MEIIIELPDFVIKLKNVSYTGYIIEPLKTDIYVTLFTQHEPIKYKISSYLSGDKLAQLTEYLIKYKS